MTTTASRFITITTTGDNNGTNIYQAPTNTNSPADNDIIALTTGDNTINVPTGGTVAKAVTIIKPAANTVLIKHKYQAGDSGYPLDSLEPDSISIGPGVTSFILNAASPVNVRLAWS